MAARPNFATSAVRGIIMDNKDESSVVSVPPADDAAPSSAGDAITAADIKAEETQVVASAEASGTAADNALIQEDTADNQTIAVPAEAKEDSTSKPPKNKTEEAAKSGTSKKGKSSGSKKGASGGMKSQNGNKKKAGIPQEGNVEDKEPPANSRKKDIHIWIDSDMYRRLQVEAEYHGTSATDMICTAVSRMMSGIPDHTKEVEKERKRKARRAY